MLPSFLIMLREGLEALAAEKPPGCTVTAAHDGLELEI